MALFDPQVTTGIALDAPRHGKSFGNLVPTSSGMPTSMVLAHARTLTVESLGTPTCRRAFLLFTEQLYRVCLAVASQRESDDAVEPRCRYLPCLKLGIPVWLVPTIISKPFKIPVVKWQAHQHRKRPAAFKYDGDLRLTPERLQLRIRQVLRHGQPSTLRPVARLCATHSVGTHGFFNN